MHGTLWLSSIRRSVPLLAIPLSIAFPALAAETRPASERPLLTILSSIHYPDHCDIGGCSPALIVDSAIHILHDGMLVEIRDAGVETEPFWSNRSDRKIGAEGLRELRPVLSQLQLLDASECEVGTTPPHGEETWTWYRTAPGSRHRFRMHLASAGSTGLPTCPPELLVLRAQAYFAIRPR